MSELAAKDTQAFEVGVPLIGIKSKHVDNQDQTLRHRTSLKNGELAQGLSSDDQYDDQEPKPKPFNPVDHNVFARSLMKVQTRAANFYNQHERTIWRLIGVILLIAFLVYFAFAMKHEFGDEGSVRLLVCTALGLALLALHLLGHHLAPITGVIDNFLTNSLYARRRLFIRRLLYVISTIGIVTLIIVLVALSNPENLLSLVGLAAFILICFVTSYSPAQVDWHPVFWGLSIQFYFAVLILKTDEGYEAFRWLGDRVTEFLAYSDAGAAFVFGNYARIDPLDGSKPIEFLGAFSLHFLAFKVMPVVTFFSTVVTISYYLGVMQAVVKVIGRFLSFCLGTSPAESLTAAGNIFVGNTESPLLIRPFIPRMTRSELHAVMTGGFATIAGSVLGAYVGFGVPADHLLSASVMSAPAALAISKLTYPEIDEVVVTADDYDNVEKTSETNLIEAVCNGAAISAKIIASILVNVIAFLSLLAFLNATLVWFGDRVGKKDFTFEYICSYVLYPIALFMGTKPDDCRKVAELVGVKIFTNEFIAYRRLADLIRNRQTLEEYEKLHPGMWKYSGNHINLTETYTILQEGVLEKRSEIIATYALCGFSNFGAIGITLGSISIMAPHRRPTMSKLVLRAMLAGNVACFCTACIAGLFYEPRDE